MKKEHVAVKVTAKNIGKLRKLFVMFPKEIFSARLSEIKEGNFIYINGFKHWVSVPSKEADISNPEVKVVTQKQLRTILAKEYLKAGDWVILKCGALVKVHNVTDDLIDCSSCYIPISNFKRYATKEEIPMIGPHAELKKAFNKGASIEVNIEGYWMHTDSPKWDRNAQYRIASKTSLEPICDII